MADKIQLPIEILTKEAIKEIKSFSRKTEMSLGGIEKKSKKASKSLTTISSSLKSINTAAKVAGATIVTALAGRAIINGISTIVNEAVSLENALTGLNAVANATGNNIETVTRSAKDLASDGLIPLTNVSNSLKNLLATGLDAEKSVKLFEALRDSASFNRQGQLDLGTAIERATEGIKNQNSTLVDNAGVTKNLSVIYKEYASTIGKTVGVLTDAEKVQAAYTGILKEARLFQGNYNMLLQTFSGAVSKVSGNWKFLLADLGELVTKSPKIVGTVNAIGEGLRELRKFINENKESLSELVNDGLLLFIKGIERTITSILNVSVFFNQFTFLLNKIGTSIAGFISKTIIQFGYLKDKIKNVFSADEVKKAIEEQRDVALKAVDEYNEAALIAEEKSKEERIKTLKELQGAVTKVYKTITESAQNNPIKIPIEADTKKTKISFKVLLDDLNDDLKNKVGLGIADGIAAVGQGKAGAKKVIAAAAKSVATSFAGPVGGAVAEAIIGPLMESPEAFAKMVKDFFKSLPELIQNILINAINIDQILTDGFIAFLDKLPEFTERITEALITRFTDPTFIARMAVGIAMAFVKATAALPGAIFNGVKKGLESSFDLIKKAFDVGKIVLESILKIASAIPNLFKKLFKFDGGGKGPVERFIGLDFPFAAFASGGRVPGRAITAGDSLKNDNVPALLSPGEIVLPRTAVNGGAGGIANFLTSLGVPGFGFGGIVGDIFGGAGGFIKDAFDTAFGSGSGKFRDVATSIARIYGGDPSAFLEEVGRLSDDAIKLFTNITSAIGINLKDVLGFGIPKDVIAALNSLLNLGANIDIRKLLPEIIKDPGNFIKSITKSILPVFSDNFKKLYENPKGMAQGGLVPAGYDNDTFPARLTSGELVVDRSTTRDLQDFLSNTNSSNADATVTNNLLSQLIDLMSGGQSVRTEVQFNQDTLADIILELNRNNARLT